MRKRSSRPQSSIRHVYPPPEFGTWVDPGIGSCCGGGLVENNLVNLNMAASSGPRSGRFEYFDRASHRIRTDDRLLTKQLLLPAELERHEVPPSGIEPD